MPQLRALAAGTLSLATIGAAVLGYSGQQVPGLDAVGLTADGKSLVAFTTDAPAEAEDAVRVTGLVGDSFLVGIDYRVQNGKLYGVGERGGIYLIEEDKASAAKVGQVVTGLNGTAFGVDFNPAANALRIVSDRGQNLRQPFGPGDNTAGDTVTDGSLNTNGGITDGIGGAAYTNNDLDPTTATSLFVINTAADQVALQSPANSGSLAATGSLGVDAGSLAGFDIYSELVDGKTVSATGFATLEVEGSHSLYSVDVLTGATAELGEFEQPVTDLAIALG